jgi:hypothetical protein
MGTRGIFGVIVGEQQKIAYNHYDSYPSGNGQANLSWLREAVEEDQIVHYRHLAQKARLVDDSVPPKAKDVQALADVTDLGVSRQDWYCLTHVTQGSIPAMLNCGYIYDSASFALDSLFCEWGYIVNFDTEMFEVYEGFQKSVPTAGLWTGRPTTEEDTETYILHLEACLKEGREPWRKRESEYKAIQRIAAYPFRDLPSEEDFLALEQREEVEV